MIYSYVFLQDNIFHYIYLSNYGMFVKNNDQIIPLNLPVTEDNEQVYGQYVLYKQSNEQLKLLQCKSQQYTYTDNINNTILNIQTPANTTIVNPQITLDIDFVNIHSTITIDILDNNNGVIFTDSFYPSTECHFHYDTIPILGTFDSIKITTIETFTGSVTCKIRYDQIIG